MRLFPSSIPCFQLIFHTKKKKKKFLNNKKEQGKKKTTIKQWPSKWFRHLSTEGEIDSQEVVWQGGNLAKFSIKRNSKIWSLGTVLLTKLSICLYKCGW